MICQLGQASLWGWRWPASDEESARADVVTDALRFGSRVIQHLAIALRQYVDRGRFCARLTPITDSARRSCDAFHITAATLDICNQINGKHVLVWDAGKGSRMGHLVSDKPKGDVELVPEQSLRQFAAAAARRMVNTLSGYGGDYTALVASDQVVCLNKRTINQLEAILAAAAAQKADLIFFDGPPALSIRRLHPLLNGSRCHRKNSALALARDRVMLKHHGGAHVFQCVLVRAPLRRPLARVLESLVRAADQGYELDFGVMDVAVVPRFVAPAWLRRENHPAAAECYSALMAWRAAVDRVFPVSVPLEAYNVNTPTMLRRLRRRIILPGAQEGPTP